MVFVDANLFVYAATDDPRRKHCLAILRMVAAGRLRGTNGSDRDRRTPASGTPGAAKHAYELLTPLLDITDEIVREALMIEVSGLGANDRLIVATCRAAGISTILSADVGVDRVPGLGRIDPLDASAVGRLLDA